MQQCMDDPSLMALVERFRDRFEYDATSGVFVLTPRRAPKRRDWSSGETQWYALRVSPQKEFVVAHMLRQRDVHTFVPTEIRQRKRNRYAKGKDGLAFPILPSCVFAGFAGPPAWFTIMRNPLIAGAIGYDGTPWRLDPIELLKWRALVPDGCLVIDGGMRLVHVSGVGLMRSPLERPHFVSKRKREPVVEPTRQERTRIGGMVLPQQLRHSVAA